MTVRFVMMFVMATPWTPFVALFQNIVTMRADSWKMLWAYQRPVPRKAQDIGTWQGIFSFIVAVSIVSNSAILVFILNRFPNLEAHNKVWLFNGLQYVLFGMLTLISTLVPDEPPEVHWQKKRQANWIRKYLDMVADEGADEPEVGTEVRTRGTDGEGEMKIGKVISVDVLADTCNIEFKDGTKEDNIPFDKVRPLEVMPGLDDDTKSNLRVYDTWEQVPGIVLPEGEDASEDKEKKT